MKNIRFLTKSQTAGLFLFVSEISFPYHKIHHFNVCNAVVLSISVKVYNHHHYLILEHFHHLWKKACTISTHSPFSLLPQPLETTHLFSVSMDLPILNISYERNHTISGLLCLASFTQHVFKVHPCCSTCQYFICPYGWMIFLCMTRPHVVHIFIPWWTFRLFPLLGHNVAAMNIHVQVSVWTIFSSLGYIPRSGIAGSYGNTMFNFLRNCQMVSAELYHFIFPPRVYEGFWPLLNHLKVWPYWVHIPTCQQSAWSWVRAQELSSLPSSHHTVRARAFTPWPSHFTCFLYLLGPRVNPRLCR